jgi:hypothetical protein
MRMRVEARRLREPSLSDPPNECTLDVVRVIEATRPLEKSFELRTHLLTKYRLERNQTANFD